MDENAKMALQRFRKLYGYDLAKARLNGSLSSIDDDSMELEILSMHHVSTSIVAVVNEVLEMTPDKPEFVAAIMATLMAHAGEMAKIMDNTVGYTDYTDNAIKIGLKALKNRRTRNE